MAAILTAAPDRETPELVYFKYYTDTPGVTTANWAWGDSQSADLPAPSGYARVSHAYATRGPFTVTVTPNAGTTSQVVAVPGLRAAARGGIDPYAPYKSVPPLPAADEGDDPEAQAASAQSRRRRGR